MLCLVGTAVGTVFKCSEYGYLLSLQLEYVCSFFDSSRTGVCHIFLLLLLLLKITRMDDFEAL